MEVEREGPGTETWRLLCLWAEKKELVSIQEKKHSWRVDAQPAAKGEGASDAWLDSD